MYSFLNLQLYSSLISAQTYTITEIIQEDTTHLILFDGW